MTTWNCRTAFAIHANVGLGPFSGVAAIETSAPGADEPSRHRVRVEIEAPTAASAAWLQDRIIGAVAVPRSSAGERAPRRTRGRR